MRLNPSGSFCSYCICVVCHLAAHEAALAAASAEGAWLPLLSMKNAAGGLQSWDPNTAPDTRPGAVYIATSSAQAVIDCTACDHDNALLWMHNTVC